MEHLEGFVEHFTYTGIFAVLFLGSLGLPIPEEMPIITAAVLAHERVVRWWLAVPVCVLGVLSGDLILYGIGRHWGRRALRWPAVHCVLTPARQRWLEAAYRRHTMKTVLIARHVMGLRAAAFLTAGITRLPVWRFIVADTAAAAVSVPLVFGLAYLFTDQVEAVMADVHRVERWTGLAALLVVAGLLFVAWRWKHRLGTTEL